MTGRCTCVMLPTDPPKWDGRQCRVHGTDVDAILADGEYRDRKGRTWSLWHDLTGGPSEWIMWGIPVEHPLTPDQMRTLIERDLHRDECPGLALCERHPAPQVWKEGHSWFLGTGWEVTMHDTFAEAVAAAHNMTGDKR